MKRVNKEVRIVLHELKGKIKASRHTLETLSPKVNIAPNTLSLKLNGNRDFTSTEICTLCNELGIEEKDIGHYFFPSMFPKETIPA